MQKNAVSFVMITLVGLALTACNLGSGAAATNTPNTAAASISSPAAGVTSAANTAINTPSNTAVNTNTAQPSATNTSVPTATAVPATTIAPTTANNAAPSKAAATSASGNAANTGNCTKGDGKTLTTAIGVQFEELLVCGGTEANQNDTVTVQYISSVKDGSTLRPLQNTYDKNEPFTFKIGANQTIQGLDQGVIGMKVGGKRRLTINPSLGYGNTGDLSRGVPSNATLIYDVELVDVKHP